MAICFATQKQIGNGDWMWDWLVLMVLLVLIGIDGIVFCDYTHFHIHSLLCSIVLFFFWASVLKLQHYMFCKSLSVGFFIFNEIHPQCRHVDSFRQARVATVFTSVIITSFFSHFVLVFFIWTPKCTFGPFSSTNCVS